MTTTKRTEIVSVDKRNGAWFCSAWHNDVTVDLTPDQLYDCAGSLALAKRVAVEMAESFGWHGGPRWETKSPKHYLLKMIPPDEDGRVNY